MGTSKLSKQKRREGETGLFIEDWLGADNQLGIDIWTKKYCHDNETFDEWLDRVSGGDQDIRRMVAEKKFLFGGRILANRGLHISGLKVTYSNCYVLTPQIGRAHV